MIELQRIHGIEESVEGIEREREPMGGKKRLEKTEGELDRVKIRRVRRYLIAKG
jgi:hypothetical protein